MWNTFKNYFERMIIMDKTKPDAIRLERAINYAVHALHGVRDKAGDPIILHSLRVMLAGKTTSEKIVGVLHNVIEDGPAGLQTYFVKWANDHITTNELMSVLALTYNRSEDTYFEYLAGVKRYDLAKAVKINDIQDNANPVRLQKLRDMGLGSTAERLSKKYAKASVFLHDIKVKGVPFGELFSEEIKTCPNCEYVHDGGCIPHNKPIPAKRCSNCLQAKCIARDSKGRTIACACWGIEEATTIKTDVIRACSNCDKKGPCDKSTGWACSKWAIKIADGPVSTKKYKVCLNCGTKPCPGYGFGSKEHCLKWTPEQVVTARAGSIFKRCYSCQSQGNCDLLPGSQTCINKSWPKEGSY